MALGLLTVVLVGFFSCFGMQIARVNELSASVMLDIPGALPVCSSLAAWCCHNRRGVDAPKCYGTDKRCCRKHGPTVPRSTPTSMPTWMPTVQPTSTSLQCSLVGAGVPVNSYPLCPTGSTETECNGADAAGRVMATVTSWMVEDNACYNGNTCSGYAVYMGSPQFFVPTYTVDATLVLDDNHSWSYYNCGR